MDEAIGAASHAPAAGGYEHEPPVCAPQVSFKERAAAAIGAVRLGASKPLSWAGELVRALFGEGALKPFLAVQSVLLAAWAFAVTGWCTLFSARPVRLPAVFMPSPLPVVRGSASGAAPSNTASPQPAAAPEAAKPEAAPPAPAEHMAASPPVRAEAAASAPVQTAEVQRADAAQATALASTTPVTHATPADTGASTQGNTTALEATCETPVNALPPPQPQATLAALELSRAGKSRHEIEALARRRRRIAAARKSLSLAQPGRDQITIDSKGDN